MKRYTNGDKIAWQNISLNMAKTITGNTPAFQTIIKEVITCYYALWYGI